MQPYFGLVFIAILALFTYQMALQLPVPELQCKMAVVALLFYIDEETGHKKMRRG